MHPDTTISLSRTSTVSAPKTKHVEGFSVACVPRRAMRFSGRSIPTVLSSGRSILRTPLSSGCSILRTPLCILMYGSVWVLYIRRYQCIINVGGEYCMILSPIVTSAYACTMQVLADHTTSRLGRCGPPRTS